MCSNLPQLLMDQDSEVFSPRVLARILMFMIFCSLFGDFYDIHYWSISHKNEFVRSSKSFDQTETDPLWVVSVHVQSDGDPARTLPAVSPQYGLTANMERIIKGQALSDAHRGGSALGDGPTSVGTWRNLFPLSENLGWRIWMALVAPETRATPLWRVLK